MTTSRHLNADERRALKAAEIGRFLREYGRKAQKGCDPNDRRFDRKTERRVRHMSAAAFDRLVREDD